MNVDFPLHFDGRGRTAATDENDYIRDMVEQVLFTSPGERMNRPDFGSVVSDSADGDDGTVSRYGNSVLAALSLIVGTLMRSVGSLGAFSRTTALRCERAGHCSSCDTDPLRSASERTVTLRYLTPVPSTNKVDDRRAAPSCKWWRHRTLRAGPGQTPPSSACPPGEIARESATVRRRIHRVSAAESH